MEDFIESIIAGDSDKLGSSVKGKDVNFINDTIVKGIESSSTLTCKGLTPLYYAASKGMADVVVQLLQISGIELDANVDPYGTALHGTLHLALSL